MSDPQAQRKRAIHFTDQLKSILDKTFGHALHWEGENPPSIKWVIKKKKKYEMRLEYNPTNDTFLLYDRDAKTQRNEVLGTFSPVNITSPDDKTLSKIVDAITEHVA